MDDLRTSLEEKLALKGLSLPKGEYYRQELELLTDVVDSGVSKFYLRALFFNLRCVRAALAFMRFI